MRLSVWNLILPPVVSLCLPVVALVLITKSHDSESSRVPSRWSVWTTSEMERVGKADRPTRQADVQIWAAGGEYEAFQIVITPGTEAVENVDVQASELIGPMRSSLPASSFIFYREHYLQIKRSSPDPGYDNRPLGKGWYPDALIPRLDSRTGRRTAGAIASFPFNTAPHENQPIWVDVHVPISARPGLYQASIWVSSNQGQVRIPISLHVWGFSLPIKPTLKSSFGMHEPALTDRRVHEVLLEHRVMPVNINPRDAREFQEQLGLNTIALRFWAHSDRNTCQMDPAPTPAVIASELALYPPDLPLYLYSADEIDPCPNLFQNVRGWGANMHAADSRIKNLVTIAPVPQLYDDGRRTGRSAVDIWTMLPKLYDSAGERVRFVQAKGDEVWSYTALVQDSYSPKWEIDFAPVNYRIQPGFLSQSLGLTGILYWRVDLWTDAPWRDVYGYHEEGNVYPGEGMLLYPGGEVGIDSVVPSMRLKWIRKGVEDYEYVAILKRLGRGGWAMSHINRAAADWRNWTQDPTLLESVRRELGDEIDKLSSSQVVNQGPRNIAQR
jgi:hypothetical protein